MSRISWVDYSFSSEGAADMEKSTYYIGRVVEEINISYRTMGLTAINTSCRGGLSFRAGDGYRKMGVGIAM